MKYSIEQAKRIIEKSIPINSIEFIGGGNHSEAYCVNNEIVIKLPKHRKASDCLKTEMQVLRGLEGKLSIDIPNVLFEGVFSAGNEEFGADFGKQVLSIYEKMNDNILGLTRDDGNMELAKRLFEFSEQLVGCEYK